MANPLTGDFDAVLQVSGGTVNRLMATLHQNAFANPKLPSFPHSVQLRLGGSQAIDGVRGLARAQVGVPRIELIHGATDRFRLEVGVRGWFIPDYDSTPFPAFIHGTVHAEYRLVDIDPHCLGWSRHAADYLWIRVVRESVRFDGTADEDANPLDSLVAVAIGPQAAADAANVAKVTRQIAGLLATRFEATPHPVSGRFHRGALRSLSAPIGGSAVATALSPSGGAPVGNIASVNNVLLDGADLALAVRVEYIMARVAQALQPIGQFRHTEQVTVHTPWPLPDIHTVYRVVVDPPTAEWKPQGDHAILKVRVHGTAKTDSIAANATFDVEQDVVMGFADGGFTLVPGAATVAVGANGLYHGTVADKVKGAVLAMLPGMVGPACNNALGAFGSMTTGLQELTDQLKSLDGQASAGLDTGMFGPDGIVLRGTIALGRRTAPVVQFEKLSDGNSFSALQSWIPGGRIDRFEWSWSWGALSSGQPGNARRDDRFLLRRPRGTAGRWGIMGGVSVPLPGLDGSGRVCLTISGVRTDSVTGNLVRVQSVQHCTVFGLYSLPFLGKAGARLFVRDATAGTGRTKISDLPLVSTGATPAGTASNTLVVHVDETWDRESAVTLERGLQACGRYDAGLSLLVLFAEGRLEADGRRAAAEVEALGRRLGIAAQVNEDVRGDWRAALRLAPDTRGTGWAIVNPSGYPAWTHRGPLGGEALGAALDEHLRPSPEASTAAHGLSRGIGEVIGSRMFDPGLVHLVEAHCPPPPLGSRGLVGSLVSFVQKGSAASLAELKHLTTRQDEGGERSMVVAIVDGADAREAEALKAAVGAEITVLADSAGAVADRFGIAIWPTTITLERDGAIGGVAAGGMAQAAAEHGPAASAV